MAYTPYYSGGWQSGEEGGTPITPDALNHMEDGIAQANEVVSVTDDIITPNTENGVSVYWQRLHIVGGRLYEMELRLRLDSAMTGRVTLGTINSSYLPGRTFNMICPAALSVNGAVNNYVNCFMAQNGNLTADYNGSAIREIYVNATYVK